MTLIKHSGETVSVFRLDIVRASLHSQLQYELGVINNHTPPDPEITPGWQIAQWISEQSFWEFYSDVVKSISDHSNSKILTSAIVPEVDCFWIKFSLYQRLPKIRLLEIEYESALKQSFNPSANFFTLAFGPHVENEEWARYDLNRSENKNPSDQSHPTPPDRRRYFFLNAFLEIIPSSGLILLTRKQSDYLCVTHLAQTAHHLGFI